jgi:hypothetical protein
MRLSYAQSVHPVRVSKKELSRIKNESGDVHLLQIDDQSLLPAIQAFVELLDRKRTEHLDASIEALAEAFGRIHPKEVDPDLILENAELRRRYLETIPTLSSEQVHALSGKTNKNVAEAASRWTREGKIFAVKAGREVRVPAFQFLDGKPRPEIAQILKELPEYQRAGWQAAFWFASGHGYLGCAPQDALSDPSRTGEVIDAARRTGRVVG